MTLPRYSVRIDSAKIKAEAKFDGKCVLITNTDLPTEQVALKYKELWRVERIFRDIKSLLETRPVYHQNDANIAGHVFSGFLALVLRKELDQPLATNDHRFEWSDIKQDLKALKQVKIEENGKRFAFRSESSESLRKNFSIGACLTSPHNQKTQLIEIVKKWYFQGRFASFYCINITGYLKLAKDI